MLYKLQFSTDHGATWHDHVSLTTFRSKKMVDAYIDKINTRGEIDWRVGWLYKLRADVRQWQFVRVNVQKVWAPQKYMP